VERDEAVHELEEQEHHEVEPVLDDALDDDGHPNLNAEKKSHENTPKRGGGRKRRVVNYIHNTKTRAPQQKRDAAR
jgi:hypothetical protein